MRQRCVLFVAVLAILLAAGCARKPDDTALVTNIKSQMFSDSQLKEASLQVASKDGQVTLSGVVPSDAARYEAYKIASQTPGVSKVNDQMTVQGAQISEAQPAAVPSPATPPPADTEPSRKTRLKRHVEETQRAERAENTAPAGPAQQYQPPADQPLPASSQPASINSGE